MALSSHSAHAILTTTAHSSSSSSSSHSHSSSVPKLLHSQHHHSSLTASLSFPSKPNTHNLFITTSDPADKWRTNVSFFPSFFINKTRDAKPIKEELLEAIEPLDRGADATPEDQQRIDQIARKLEAVNPTKEPLKSDLLNGKWELIYTTSRSILQTGRPKFLRSRTNYQGINVDTLRAQNMESWPFFNQVTGDLTPLNLRKVAVKFDYFKIAGLIPVKAPGRARGELEITYLDEELRFDGGAPGQGSSATPRRRSKTPQQQAAGMGPPPRTINLISCEPMAHVSDIKLIRTDTTLDLSQKAEKGYQEATKGTCSS